MLIALINDPIVRHIVLEAEFISKAKARKHITFRRQVIFSVNVNYLAELWYKHLEEEEIMQCFLKNNHNYKSHSVSRGVLVQTDSLSPLK